MISTNNVKAISFELRSMMGEVRDINRDEGNSDARLHFPVSGISFLGPCFSFLSRIPQDSCGFLFFPEEFFHRNLLLAGVRKLRFLAKLTGILHRFLYIPAFDPDSCIFLRNPPRITPESPEYSGIPVPAKFPPTKTTVI